MISFVIPAHNEEYLIGQTLEHVMAAARGVGQPFEVIVVDDASTDRTAAIAQKAGAQVLPVNHRKIAAVRNAGAAHATGDVLVFIDADTLLPEPTLRGAVVALADGAVGGGARIGVSDQISVLPRVILGIWNIISRVLRWAPGCFIFVRRDAFEAVGGFDEQYYVAEELYLSHALKQQGRFVILPHRVYTSGRKARMYTLGQLMSKTLRILISGPSGFRRRQGLDLWYDAPREGVDIASNDSPQRSG